VLAVALIAAATPQSEDPDWPCQQRFVLRLSAAAYWSGPFEAPDDWRADPEIANLVQRLAPRRVTTQEGLDAIASFTQNVSGDRPRHLALVFRGLLEETNRQRAELIEKLKQIGRRQRELADLAARLADELRSIRPPPPAKPPPSASTCSSATISLRVISKKSSARSATPARCPSSSTAARRLGARIADGSLRVGLLFRPSR